MANNLYKYIIIVVVITAICLIAYGLLDKDIRTRVQKTPTDSSVPASINP